MDLQSSVVAMVKAIQYNHKCKLSATPKFIQSYNHRYAKIIAKSHHFEASSAGPGGDILCDRLKGLLIIKRKKL